MVAVYPIVEGHGEVRAFPILVRRIATEICDRHDVQVLPPHRIPRGRMVARDSQALEHAIELGVRKIRQSGGSGIVIVELDADDDCPAELGPRLLASVRRPDVAVSVIVANREYEAWLLAGAQSLRDHRLVSDDATVPPEPESIRGAKEYLERRILVAGARYSETVDQPALTSIFDLATAATAAPSLDKLCRDLCRLLAIAAPVC